MFILTILEKNQRKEVEVFSRKCNSLIKYGKLSRSKKQHLIHYFVFLLVLKNDVLLVMMELFQ